jgi:YebC/PmpR family DNA-binding regulatory protein
MTASTSSFSPRFPTRSPAHEHNIHTSESGTVVSGHSKWATIKHQKGAKDKARGKLFAKLIRQVEVAARSGGADLTANATLRTMYAKARAASVPIDTIERAVKRGTGELEGVTYESITYEGYAPGGVAILVDVLTDNRNRTGPEIRSMFTRLGGSMAEPGAVAWQFSRCGLVYVPGTVGEDDLMLVAIDAGASDVVADGSAWKITCEPGSVETMREALEAAGIAVESAESTMVSSTIIELTSAEEARKVLRVMDGLEEHDDVQDVYANFDISEDILALVEA